MTLSNHTDFVAGVAFSSDHSYLASCSQDTYLNIWSATTSWSLNSYSNDEVCNALIQLPNGQLAAASAYNINIWSPLNNSPVPDRTLTGHTSFVYSLALSLDGLLLASGSDDSTIKLWNYATSLPALKTLTGHSTQVKSVCFVSDQIVASGSVDLTIKIWNLTSGN